jgi:hypothetical protein
MPLVIARHPRSPSEFAFCRFPVFPNSPNLPSPTPPAPTPPLQPSPLRLRWVYRETVSRYYSLAAAISRWLSSPPSWIIIGLTGHSRRRAGSRGGNSRGPVLDPANLAFLGGHGAPFAPATPDYTFPLIGGARQSFVSPAARRRATRSRFSVIFHQDPAGTIKKRGPEVLICSRTVPRSGNDRERTSERVN